MLMFVSFGLNKIYNAGVSEGLSVGFFVAVFCHKKDSQPCGALKQAVAIGWRRVRTMGV